MKTSKFFCLLILLLSSILVFNSCTDDCDDINSNCYNSDPSYQPFSLQDAVWKVNWSQSPCQGVCGQLQYYTNGDTTINNMNYTKIRAYAISYFDSDTIDFLKGFIRNDIWNKRVYMLENMAGANEMLIYDFNVVLGDTINHRGDSAVLESVDTIMMANFDLLKYNYDVIQNEPFIIKFDFSIIEGIGSTTGLWEGISKATVNLDHTDLECFKVLNSFSYPVNSPCISIID